VVAPIKTKQNNKNLLIPKLLIRLPKRLKFIGKSGYLLNKLEKLTINTLNDNIIIKKLIEL